MNEYPPSPTPSPTPTPTTSHTSVPPLHSPPTANTGAGLFGPSMILGGLLLLSALAFAVRRLFAGEGDL